MQKLNTRISSLKVLMVLPLIVFYTNATAQKADNVSLELIGSYFFNSERHANENGDQDVYSELRAGVRLSKYLELNAGVGHQSRSFIYFAQQSNGSLIPLYLKRKYVPVSASLRLYLSEFFYEKLKLWKKPGRFDVYYQLGVATLKGKDIRDEREDAFRAQGYYVPFYLIPFIQEYGKIYPTNLAGIRYNFNPHIGLFIEGGDGALMTLQIGLSARF